MISRGIHKDAIIDSEGICELPQTTVMEPGSVIHVGREGRIQLGERNIIHSNASIRIARGWLVTGDDVSFGPGCHIFEPHAGLEIGRDCQISSGVLIGGLNHGQMRPDLPMRRQPTESLPIRIEDDVWVGMGAIIHPGVTIGAGAVIGTGSVVTRSIPPNAVAWGSPCRVRRMRNGTGLFSSTTDGPIRLHLGCGSRYIPGFFHLDAQLFPHVDLVTDVAHLDAIPSATVDLIYASHLLEHFGRWEFRAALTEWRRVLKPGGRLRLAVPDFAACAKLYYEQGLADGLTGLIGLICGGQRDSHDFHKMIFDEPFLTRELQGLGFRQVRRWDWRATEHTEVDDYSQAYIPHLDKEDGTLMSLNLEAMR
ncbi:DapH/DapD/GlmU-related protein [Thiocystis violacea]|uniref:DapH/DapD/GlmU-related protein n=1 Tax=Thiocystis violacea TaxID=13725 RepID=UPI001903F0DD|nr:DapH/DapD/GlmU-related protein [Thiocystis violacea]